MNLRTFIIAISFLLAHQCKGQNIQISGTIKDLESNVIEGASILLKGTTRYAESNAKGQYTIQNIGAGTYVLSIYSTGFESQEIAFTIAENESKQIDVILKTISFEGPEINVVARRADARHMQEVDGYSIFATKKNEQINIGALNANLAMNNSRQIFSKIPGISVWESDGSGIQMSVASRGLSPNRSWEFNTRLNGYDITPDPMGYPEAYYTPPTEVVEKIELVRGASSLQYGPQFGGLLNFVLRKPDLSTKFTIESQNTIGSNGLLSTFNYIGGTIKRLSYTAYYQKRKGDGWRDNSYFNTDHAHVALSYAASEKLRIGAEVTYMDYISQQAGGLTDSLFKVDPRQSLRSRNWFSAPWLVPSISAEYIFNEDARINIKTFGTIGDRNSAGFTKAINIKDDLSNRQVDVDQYRNIGTEVRFIKDLKIKNQKHTLASGLRFYNGNTRRLQQGIGDKANDYNITLEPEKSYVRDLNFSNTNFASFAEALIRFNEKLVLTTGLRFEHISSTGEGRLGYKDGKELLINNIARTRDFVIFGSGLEYHTSPEREFYTNISQAYRPVLYSDLTPPATTDIIDENLSDANGFNFDFGYRGRIKNYLNFDVDYFYINYNNRIGTIAKLDNNTIYQFRTNLGRSTSQGFEGFIEFKPLALMKMYKYGSLNLFASIAHIDAQYNNFKTTSVSNGKIIETNLAGKQVENAPSKINRYGITYTFKDFSITWQLSDIGSAYADAANTVNSNPSSTTGLIPGYRVQDLSASVKLFKNYILKAGINNLADATYFTRRAGGYPGPGILPGDGRTFYASFGVKF
jgi:Fe(3+) dicitrate transport protein